MLLTIKHAIGVEQLDSLSESSPLKMFTRGGVGGLKFAGVWSWGLRRWRGGVKCPLSTTPQGWSSWIFRQKAPLSKCLKIHHRRVGKRMTFWSRARLKKVLKQSIHVSGTHHVTRSCCMCATIDYFCEKRNFSAGFLHFGA